SDVSADERAIPRKKYGRGLGVDQALIHAFHGIETLGVSECSVELADGVTDRGLQHYTIAHFRQVDVRGEPVGYLTDRDVWPVFSPQWPQLQPERVRPQLLQHDAVGARLLVDAGRYRSLVLRAQRQMVQLERLTCFRRVGLHREEDMVPRVPYGPHRAFLARLRAVLCGGRLRLRQLPLEALVACDVGPGHRTPHRLPSRR